jgi:hypothetical protein
VSGNFYPSVGPLHYDPELCDLRKPTAMQLDHINISTPADPMEKLKDFYCTALGFAVGHRPDIPIPGYWLYPESGGPASVHLIESNRLPGWGILI